MHPPHREGKLSRKSFLFPHGVGGGDFSRARGSSLLHPKVSFQGLDGPRWSGGAPAEKYTEAHGEHCLEGLLGPWNLEPRWLNCLSMVFGVRKGPAVDCVSMFSCVSRISCVRKGLAVSCVRKGLAVNCVSMASCVRKGLAANCVSMFPRFPRSPPPAFLPIPPPALHT